MTRSLITLPARLFRQAQNALEQGVQQKHNNSQALQQSNTWMRSITWSLVAATGAGLVWLIFARTDEVVVAPGKLEPIGAVKEVRLPVGGVVKQVLVQGGQRVQKGQVLLRMDTEASKTRQGNLVKAIALKQQQLVSKEEELNRYKQLNSTQTRVLTQNLALERQIERRLERLAREGASSELQYLQQRNRVQEVSGQLQQTKVDRLRQQAILAQQTDQLRSELGELRSQLSDISVNLRYQEVRSPVAGWVFDLKPSPGFVAQTSEPVLKVVPVDRLEARVEVASSDIGFVSVGRPVEISIDSYPSSDFGALRGTIRKIGSDALPPDALKPVYRFPADIKLESQVLKLKNGKSLPLQVGMSLTANIKLRNVTYLQLFLSGFRDKADSVRQVGAGHSLKELEQRGGAQQR